MTIPLYLRREPTKPNQIKANMDVVGYLDADARVFMGRWKGKGRPKAKDQTVRFNCSEWPVVWLADKPYTDRVGYQPITNAELAATAQQIAEAA